MGVYGRLSDAWLESIRNALSVPEAEAAWAEGQAMTLEQVISYALAEDGT